MNYKINLDIYSCIAQTANLTKKSYQLRYFFIDNQANLFYLPNLPKLQKIMRISKDVKQLKTKLIRNGEKSFQLTSFIISAPKTYNTQSVLPFCNRTYIEIKEKQQKDSKTQDRSGYMLMGFMDEDTVAIYQEILILTGKKKKQVLKRKSVSEKLPEEVEKKVFDSYIECSDSFSMQKQEQDSQYDGMQIDGKASGKGKQVIVSKGMSYNGIFHDGKKHGKGYLVDKNLDTMECEFVNDELVGI